jgi:hypothetical protein
MDLGAEPRFSRAAGEQPVPSGVGSGRDTVLLQRHSTDGGYTDAELNAAFSTASSNSLAGIRDT